MGANIYDVFKSGAQFASTGLSIADSINREKAKAELQTAELTMQTEFNNYLLDLSQRSDFDKFGSDWENKKIKIYNDVSGTLSSPFAKDAATHLFKTLDSNQQLKIEAETIKRTADYTATTVQNNNNTIMASLAYTKEEKLAMTQQNWGGLYETGVIDYSTYNARIMENGASIALDTLKNDARAVLEEEGIEKALSYIQTNEDSLVLKNGAEIPMDAIREQAGKDIKNEWSTAEAFRKMRQEEMWTKNENTASQIYLEMLSGGGPQSAVKGMAFLKNLGRTGLDAGRRDEYAQKFQTFLDDPKGGTDKGLKDLVESNLGEFIRLTVAGSKGTEGGYINAESGAKAMESWINDQLAMTGVEKPHARSAFPDTFKKFYDEIIKQAPQSVQVKLKDVKTLAERTYLEAAKKKKTGDLSAEQTAELNNLQGHFMQSMYDYILSTDFSEQSPEMAQKRLDNMVAGFYGDKYEILKTNHKTGESNYKRGFFQSEDDLAVKAIEALENPELVYTDKDGNAHFIPRVEDGVQKGFNQYARNQIATLTGKPVESISQTWEVTENGRDKDARSIFTVTGSAKQYRYTTDGKKPILQERSRSSDDWKPIETVAQKTQTDKKERRTDRTDASREAVDIFREKYEELIDKPLAGYTDATWSELTENERFSLIDSFAMANPSAFTAWAEPQPTDAKKYLPRKMGGR